MTEAGPVLLRHLIGTLKIHKVEAMIRGDNRPRRHWRGGWVFGWRAARSATVGWWVADGAASCCTA
jgi:hypothetical protein